VLVDARALPNERRLHADVCIIGAGAAGLTIADALARAGLRLVVLEGGGLHTRGETQDLYRGVVSGDPYYALEACRFRALGGSTSAWGGWCRPLDAGDFEPLGEADGWPFSKIDLEPFYAQAEAVCRLPPTDAHDDRWNVAGPPPLLRPDRALFEIAKFQVQPVRFGPLYRPLFERSRKADLLLNANAVNVAFDVRSRTARHVRAATLNGNSITVQADKVVLAAGGLENPRLLLASPGWRGGGVGNQHDLVGRYFSDHLHVALGTVRPTSVSDDYQLHWSNGAATRFGLVPTATARARTHTPGFAITLHNARDPHDIVALGQRSDAAALVQSLGTVLRGRQRADAGVQRLRTVVSEIPEICHHVYRRFVKPTATDLLIGCRAEQLPDPDCRVILDSRRDRLGMPLIRLHWRIGACDRTTVARAQAMIAEALADTSVRLFPLEPDARGRRGQPVWGGAHHIGTTRMARDPRYGVVDEHGRIHGARNLYVAGSSVFPRGGWAPPTLTIVALALRLADHLASDTSPGYATA
jgi:choline dehydrogenase-like flavoprotein